jgi:hypothetical protein
MSIQFAPILAASVLGTFSTESVTSVGLGSFATFCLAPPTLVYFDGQKPRTLTLAEAVSLAVP